MFAICFMQIFSHFWSLDEECSFLSVVVGILALRTDVGEPVFFTLGEYVLLLFEIE